MSTQINCFMAKMGEKNLIVYGTQFSSAPLCIDDILGLKDVNVMLLENRVVQLVIVINDI